MATNLAIDDALIEEARKIGNKSTKRAVVTEALKEYIQRRQQVPFYQFLQIGRIFHVHHIYPTSPVLIILFTIDYCFGTC
jgi:hypothetical protein